MSNINFSQQPLKQEVLSELDEVEDDILSELSLGSFEEQEELTEEDIMKIERWTRIREDGFEMINGVKYSETGSIIYSDYDRDEEVDEGTASEIAAKMRGDLLRAQAKQRIEDNPQAYKGLPRPEDEEDEDWNALIERFYERQERERDIYLANGGITNEELPYLERRIIMN